MLYLTTLLFCCKNHAAQVYFVSFFSAFCSKIEKNLPIFSLCVSMIYEKVEKKVCQNS